jgi:cold shock CspA family protein
VIIGKVSKIMDDKNFGFILADGYPKEFFFHRDDCECDFYELAMGARVQFISADVGKGPRAIDVDFYLG